MPNGYVNNSSSWFGSNSSNWIGFRFFIAETTIIIDSDHLNFTAAAIFFFFSSLSSVVFEVRN